MFKVSARALIGLFLLAEVVVPYTAYAYFEPLQVYQSLSYFSRILGFGGISYESPMSEDEIIAAEWVVEEPDVILMPVVITGYSSSPDETDDDPFITASGNSVRDGIVATNMFSFGTRVKIPEIFGDKVFVVEDRMHARFSDRIDVWFPSKSEALRFGVKHTLIEIES